MSNNKMLTLLPKNFLPEKAEKEIEIAKQIGLLMEGENFYYSKEFGLIKITIPKAKGNGVKFNKFNVSNKIQFIQIEVIHPGSYDGFKDQYISQNMKNIAEHIEFFSKGGLASAFVSTDSLPGYKIIPNEKEYENKQGDIIFTKEYGILFIQVLDIHIDNYIKNGDTWELK
jgi:hypothetical protein